jgi:hypothetical protein
MPTALASKEKCIQKVFWKGNFKIGLTQGLNNNV